MPYPDRLRHPGDRLSGDGVGCEEMLSGLQSEVFIRKEPRPDRIIPGLLVQDGRFSGERKLARGRPAAILQLFGKIDPGHFGGTATPLGENE